MIEMAVRDTMKFQVDTGVNVNTIRKAILSTMKIQTVILRTTALPKLSNTTDANTN